jgi:membrane protein implicated in regulation of membrane protease activity
MTNTTTTKDITIGRRVTMTQDASDGFARRTIRGLGWKALDALNSGDTITITDADGVWIADVLDVVPEYGYVWIEFI